MVQVCDDDMSHSHQRKALRDYELKMVLLHINFMTFVSCDVFCLAAVSKLNMDLHIYTYVTGK